MQSRLPINKRIRPISDRQADRAIENPGAF
jgi:hypothetical protein